MKKRNMFLSGLFATCLLAVGCLVGCSGEATTDPDDPVEPTTPATTTYRVAFAETNGVDASLSATEAEAGTTIEITINSVPEDYEIVSITTDVDRTTVTAASSTLWTFMMPESDVNLTINVTETLKNAYTLEIVDNASAGISSVWDGDGIAEFDSATGLYTITTNNTVLINLTSSGTYAGYLNDSSSAVSYNASYNQLSFTMPARNSVLRIEEAEAYTVSVTFTDEDHISEWYLIAGDTTTNSRSFPEGTSLGLQVITESGYEILEVSADTTTMNYLSSIEWSFTMPAADVNITVTTQEAQDDGGADEGNTGTITLNRDLGSTINFTMYSSDVLANLTSTDDDSANPSNFAISDYDADGRTFEVNTRLAFTASFSTTYQYMYEIDEVKVNGVSVKDTLTKYTYIYYQYYTRSTDLSLYYFDVKEGENVIEITSKQVEVELTITLDEEGESATVSRLLKDSSGNLTGGEETLTASSSSATSVSYGAYVSDTYKVKFSHTDTAKKVASFTNSYAYTTLTAVEGEANTYTFTYPNRSSFTINPNWVSGYQVSVSTSEDVTGLSISATVADVAAESWSSFIAYESETVKLELTWTDTTKVITSVAATTATETLTVSSTGDGTTGSTYSFTMPAAAVSVEVTFGDASAVEPDPSYTVKVRNTGEITSLSALYLEKATGGDVDSEDVDSYRVWSDVTVGDTYNLGLWSNNAGYDNYITTITVEDNVVDLGTATATSSVIYWTFTMPAADVVITINWATASEPETYSIKIANTGDMTDWTDFYLESGIGTDYTNNYVVSDSYRVWSGFSGTESLTFGFYGNSANYSNYTVVATDVNGVIEQGIKLDWQQSNSIYWSFQMPTADVEITIHWTAL